MRFSKGVAGAITALAFVVGSCSTTAADSAAPAKPASNPASASKNAAPKAGGQQLFDGKTLTGWVATDFAGKGSVTVSNGQINLGSGYMTGVTCTSDVPKMNYEVSLDAKRVDGNDFFCGLTFPVGTNHLTFVVGGWGGGVVGISSVDGEDASQNETTKYMNFVNGRWYHVRVRVTPKKVMAWIDDEEVTNLEIEDRRLSIRFEVEPSAPLGVATWSTAAALRNIQVKRL